MGILIFIFSIPVHAQKEWENIYNPRTGTYERIYNPGNPAQAAIEQQQREAQADAIIRQGNENIREINDTYNRRREAANEQTKRNQEFWDDMARDMQFKMIEMNSRRNYGNSIIKAGKASSTYQPTQNFNFINLLAKRAKNKQQLDLIEQYAAASMKKFQSELATRGLVKNDLADGVVNVFAMAFEVYENQKVSNAVGQKMRQEIKASLLKTPIFQSYTSAEREEDYALYATLAGYCKILFEKGVKGDKAALIEAQSTAKGLLEKFWGNGVNTLQLTSVGFVHKGAKIIADGKATNLFKYNPNLGVAEMGNAHVDIKTQNSQNIQRFYQEMTKRGGQKGDLAWCGTMAGNINYYVLTKQEWTPVQTKSVYDFMKTKINTLPDIQAADDNSKQIACEQLVMNTMSNYARFIKGEYTAYYTNSTATNILQGLFKALGEDINNYQWTANGIVKVK